MRRKLMRLHCGRTLPLLAATAVMSGCFSVGPDYERPEPGLPDTWSKALLEPSSGHLEVGKMAGRGLDGDQVFELLKKNRQTLTEEVDGAHSR